MRGTADLEGVPIFYERWTRGPNAASFFDAAVDGDVRGAFIRERTRQGYCNLHGVRTTFTLDGPVLREDLRSADCGAIARNRALAAALSCALFGDPFSSLRQTCAALNATNRRLFTAESSGAVCDELAASLETGRLVCSEFFGAEFRQGELVGGVRHEDLQRLSFADETFDVVMTADVMEHVPDALAAEREVVRVLRRGGVYCFSVPLYVSLERDRVRAVLHATGSIEHLETPDYHGDPLHPDQGVLVFRDFSESGLRARFAALGCTLDILRLWSSTLGIIGHGMRVMIARRLP